MLAASQRHHDDPHGNKHHHHHHHHHHHPQLSGVGGGGGVGSGLHHHHHHNNQLGGVGGVGGVGVIGGGGGTVSMSCSPAPDSSQDGVDDEKLDVVGTSDGRDGASPLHISDGRRPLLFFLQS